MQALICDKSSRESLGAAQRVRWLAAGVFASPEDYIGRLEGCVGERAERARHVAAFFDAGGIAPTRRVESEGRTVFVGTSDEAQRHSVASFLGERLGARVLDRLIRLTGRTRSPQAGVSELIRGLAVLPDAEASSLLESLASDPALCARGAELTRARDDQLAVRRDAAYRHPDAEQVCRALDDGPPANAGDLAALVTDRLDEMGVRIRNDNANGWRLCIRLPGAGLIFSGVNGRKWTEPPGKLLHDEVVPAQICRHRGVGLCGCEGVGNEGHEGRLAGRRTCAEHVAVESAHGRLAVPLSPRQLVSASSAATVGPGGSLAGRWVWRLPRRIPVPHGGARPRGSRRWRRRQ